MKKSDNAYYDVDEFIKKHYDGTYSTILRLNKQGAYNAQVLDELNLVIDTFLNGKLIESVVLGNTFMQSTQEGYVMRWFDYQLLKPHAKYIIAPKDDDMIAPSPKCHANKIYPFFIFFSPRMIKFVHLHFQIPIGQSLTPYVTDRAVGVMVYAHPISRFYLSNNYIPAFCLLLSTDNDRHGSTHNTNSFSQL